MKKTNYKFLIASGLAVVVIGLVLAACSDKFLDKPPIGLPEVSFTVATSLTRRTSTLNTVS